MSGTTIDFLVHTGGTATRQPVTLRRLVIAGWTGRDPVARDKHIAELEELGIPRPATTPIYYEVAASRLTTADGIEVSGGDSSGEVEFVLVQSGGRLLVGVGSDHTDRKVETYNITVSKQMCDKPVAPELWLVDDVAAHWDKLMLRAYATIDGERVLYQEGALSGMLAPADLVARRHGQAGLPEGTAMFGGTFAAKGGIRPADRFEFELADPVLNRVIRHGYAITQLGIAG
ncbi:DUF2848 domain-containing protein [Bradyrhizobium sp. STM 3809]|uniref:DUF2848 domain-containing protein n=1 Tax=Bradyrhizobium sp. STM 3809 TaxID=551936 RepID=UPI000240A311|nr:DUF2848 domain-containing protein [Bradyrhizobium sp. STM 3809]CCE03400.1 conserved hypothetical protein [Bradyrhizobium sp. STM 3809]